MVRPKAMIKSTLPFVIFDCDGVLVDSEVIASRVFAECLAEAGIALSVDEAMAFGVGKSAATLAAAVEAEFGRTLPAGFIEGMRMRVMDAFTSELRPIDGIDRLLTALKPACCVASNSHIDRVRHALATTGLLAHLDPHIYIAAMVARGKPAPDLFLFAAGRHEVEPARCLVVEGSLSGVEAALAAGMLVVGFTGGSHCRAGHAAAMLDAGCRRIFARMDERTDFLGALPASNA
jgi:HAD superfamily hydrolase (TIGR01509 family)